MSQARVLYDLQQIDSEIRTGKHRLGEVLRLQKEPAELISAREQAKAAGEELQRWQNQQKRLSMEIESIADKNKRSEERLYSGNVKNPKELNDLQHEIDALGRRRAALEEEALEVMMRIDENQVKKAAVDGDVDRLAQAWQQSSASYHQEQQTLALHLNKLLEKRQRQAQLAQSDCLRIYDKLLQQKNGLAAAGLREAKCQVCRVTVSASTVRAAEEGKLVYCDSCGRILCPV
jgi:predicted  nucleic acid-binding Zn-ribbon protein